MLARVTALAPGPLDHLLFAVLAVLFPIRAATFGFRRLERAAEVELPQVRRMVYRQAMALQWALVAVVVALWWVTGRPWSALGLVPRLTWGLGGVLVGLLVVIAMIVRQRRAAFEDDSALERLRDRFRRMQRMLPTNRDELAAFYRLSVTAGICEELLYRGYVIWYLNLLAITVGHCPAAPAFWLAAAVSSILFGIGHVYQGPRGMVLTGLVGMFFASVYWISESLVAPMLLHVLMDAHSGNVLYHALERERASADEAPLDDAASEGDDPVPVTPPPG